MKKSTSSSKKDKTEPEAQPMKRAPKGHRQRGAGTVSTGKAERVVSGVVIKEWQRTPKKLIEEWCQRQKRPRPVYSRASKKDQKHSDHSAEGTGDVRCWLTLPDPKKTDKLVLKFLTEQGFSSNLEAEHASALLALHHINPDIPHERVLPEPHRSMWLQLVGRQDNDTGADKSVGDVGSKKPKKVAAWRVAEEEAKAKAEALKNEQEESSKTKSKKKDKASFKDNNLEKEIQTESNNILPTPPPLKTKVVVDPDAVVSLSSSLKFASVKEKEMYQLERAEERAKKQKSKHSKQLANPDSICHMEERHRIVIEGLIQDADRLRKSLQPSDGRRKITAGSNEDIDWATIEKRLLAAGFTVGHVEMLHTVTPISDSFTLFECLDWLCLNLPENELPKHFAAKGKYLEVLRSGKNVQSLNDDVDDVLAKTPEVIVADQGDILKDKLEVLSVDERYLMDMGFSINDIKLALSTCESKYDAFWKLCGKVCDGLSDRSDCDQEDFIEVDNEMEIQRMEEKEVLHSIFENTFFVHQENYDEVWQLQLDVAVSTKVLRVIGNGAWLGNVSGELTSTVVISTTLEMHLPPRARGRKPYPSAPPIMLLVGGRPKVEHDKGDFSSLFSLPSVRCEVTKALSHFVTTDELRGQAVMYECSLWVQDEENGLGALLRKLATARQTRKSSDPSKVNPQLKSEYDFDRTLTNSNDQVIAQDVSRKPSIKFAKGLKTRLLLTKKEASHLSTVLLEDWTRKTKGSDKLGNEYRRLLEERKKLPAAEYKEKLLATISSHQVVLLSGETGCGKTTQVPQYVLEDYISRGLGGEVSLVCTQPRRLAAMGVAERVASEHCCQLGETVGYQVRMDSCRNRNTRLVYCTTGILLRQLHGDPDLKEITHLLVDEVHERDVDTDFLLALIKPLLLRRKDLKLILMSATMDTSTFLQYFSNGQTLPPIINIPGFVHPVAEYYLEDLESVFSTSPLSIKERKRSDNSRFDDDDDDDALDRITEEDSAQEFEGLTNEKTCCNEEETHRKINYEQKYRGHRLYPLIAKTVIHADRLGTGANDDGAILVFVSGVGEVTRTITEISQLAIRMGQSNRLHILPLHGSLTASEQHKVFQRPKKGQRKVVVSTNVAETSITIDDCVFVIDSGRMKEMAFEPESRLSALAEIDISAANARQRRGRAGRVRPGHCFRLFTRAKCKALAPHQTPEIHRVPLERLCLLVRYLNLGRPKLFLQQVIEPPAEAGVLAALRHLRALGAMDERNCLTPLGRHLASMPVDAQVGKLLIFGSLLRCPDSILTIAAGLSVRSPFTHDEVAEISKRRLSGRNMSDHLALLAAVNSWREIQSAGGSGSTREYCRNMGLHFEGLKQLWDTRKQLRMALQDAGFSSSHVENNNANIEVIKAALCAGLYPQVARVHLPEKQYEELSGGSFQKNAPAKDIKFFVREDESFSDNSHNDDTALEKIKERTMRVFLHPSSALFAQGSMAYTVPWLIYSSKVRTSKIFLREVSMVSVYSLLLFGGQGNLEVLHDKGKVVLDGWMYFTAPARVGLLVRELRREMESLLQDKIAMPQLDLSANPVIDAVLLLLQTNGL